MRLRSWRDAWTIAGARAACGGGASVTTPDGRSSSVSYTARVRVSRGRSTKSGRYELSNSTTASTPAPSINATADPEDRVARASTRRPRAATIAKTTITASQNRPVSRRLANPGTCSRSVRKGPPHQPSTGPKDRRNAVQATATRGAKNSRSGSGSAGPSAGRVADRRPVAIRRLTTSNPNTIRPTRTDNPGKNPPRSPMTPGSSNNPTYSGLRGSSAR